MNWSCEIAWLDIYFVPKFLIEVLNNVSCNFFYEDNNFLSLRLIDFAFLRIFDAVSKVVITALSQKIFELNLGIPESRELFPGLSRKVLAHRILSRKLALFLLR